MAIYGVEVDLARFPDHAFIESDLRAQFLSLCTAYLVRATPREDTVDLWFQGPPPNDDQLTSVISKHRASLDLAKQQKFAAIDDKTDEIIARGFTFAGKQFSTSLEAQARTLGMDTLRNDPAMQYPITYNTLDDTNAIQLASAEDVHNFFLTGMAYYRVAIDTGSALKAAVRAAADIASVGAVTDGRT